MFCEGCSEPVEMQSVVRKQNRVLRCIVRSLRKQVQRLRAQADEMFFTVCDSESNAEKAFRELWETGFFDCGPQDYESIVKQCNAAMAALRIEHTGQAKSYPACSNLRQTALTGTVDYLNGE